MPFNVRDEQLRDLFKEFDVKTAYVAVRRNGRSKGFGFVNLANSADQNRAISSVDGKEFEGRKLTAKIACNDDRRNEKGELLEEYKKALLTRNEGPPSETFVYVSNLPWSYKDQDLQKLFAELNVKNANVAVRRTGKSKGFGFVEFASKEDQQKALQQDQKKIEDRVITVKPSVNYRGPNPQPREDSNNGGRKTSRGPRREARHNSENRSGSTGGKNVTVRPPRQSARTENTLYIYNLPFDLEDGDLKSIFSEFNVKSAHVATRGGSGRSLGFGFVEFNNAQDQKNALDALDQSEVNGHVVTIKIATGKSSRPSRRRDSGNRRRGESGNRRDSGNADGLKPESECNHEWSNVYELNVCFSCGIYEEVQDEDEDQDEIIMKFILIPTLVENIKVDKKVQFKRALNMDSPLAKSLKTIINEKKEELDLHLIKSPLGFQFMEVKANKKIDVNLLEETPRQLMEKEKNGEKLELRKDAQISIRFRVNSTKHK